MEKAIFFALSTVSEFIIFIVINFFAPSPSTTICFAKSKQTVFKAFSNFIDSLLEVTFNFLF